MYFVSLAGFPCINKEHQGKKGKSRCKWIIFVILSYVTGSEKSWHNYASLNLQYKALGAIGAILAYC